MNILNSAAGNDQRGNHYEGESKPLEKSRELGTEEVVIGMRTAQERVRADNGAAQRSVLAGMGINLPNF